MMTNTRKFMYGLRASVESLTHPGVMPPGGFLSTYCRMCIDQAAVCMSEIALGTPHAARRSSS